MAVFPKEEWDGNVQDTSNDGVPDPKKFQAADYNETADEVKAIQSELRNGLILAVRNESGGTLNEGDYVRIVGIAISGLPKVVKAIATSESTLADGVIIATIGNNNDGNISSRHLQKNINTSALGVSGTPLFLSDTAAGGLTTTKPALIQKIGVVAEQNASTGAIYSSVDASGGSASVPGHATSHGEGQSDEVTVENLATASSDTARRLAPDGAGGLVFAEGPGFIEDTASTSGAATATPTTIPIADETSILVVAYIVGRRSNGADRFGFIRRANVHRVSAGVATIEGIVDTPYSRRSTSPSLAIDATIGTSGNNATIEVTGDTGLDINWRVKHFTVVEP